MIQETKYLNTALIYSEAQIYQIKPNNIDGICGISSMYCRQKKYFHNIIRKNEWRLKTTGDGVF